ncbi:NAD(+)/NADH kinase [Desulfurococcus mucosus]|uniref:ATP-NAD/AcoX kinase n=1 Tax=Desulfurococcus mucosus (strain ATCC 35584 / DSM 2162 / JCM 9187 / O7/1) TaxID=765177 RepID=E8RA75_DESM0|nr:NAD(+)/NADH kinase [Desulfurococcus mucosus]ADV65381.1 ATP-NAD/AcoX kinase [Desulfurococcus mucosus DSM 2162]
MYPVSSVYVVYKPTRECMDIAKKYSDLFKGRGVSVEVSTVDDASTRSVVDKDLVLSVGGDGTILRISLMLQGESTTPLILPHPCGRRNTFYDEDIPSASLIVEKVLKGDFMVQLYPRGRVCVRDRCVYFLNEAAVLNMDMGRVIGFTVTVRSAGVYSRYDFEGDGFIVSTAPGSAGYNLSARGPLVAGWGDELVLTHLNPMQLGIPSITLPAYVSVVEAASRGYTVLYVDGEKMRLLDRREPVRITGGVGFLKLVRFSSGRDLIKIVLGKRRVVY